MERDTRHPTSLIDMVERGLLGRKTGQGFFKWEWTQPKGNHSVDFMIPRTCHSAAIAMLKALPV